MYFTKVEYEGMFPKLLMKVPLGAGCETSTPWNVTGLFICATFMLNTFEINK